MTQNFNKLKLVPTLLLSFFLSSCLEKSMEDTGQADKDLIGETVYVTLTSADSRSSQRYLGTYQDVDGVVLNYRRSDGVGDNQSVELELVPSTYGSATTTMQWTGAINNVIPGARYDFDAKAFTLGMKCYQELRDMESTETNQYYDNPDFPGYDSPEIDNCQNLRQADPTEHMDVSPYSNDFDGRYLQFKAYLFNGTKNYFKLETGNNDLQIRMSPKLRPSADGQMIPYISKIDRPQSYAAGDIVNLDVQFKGPEGYIIGLLGKVVGTCAIEEEEKNTCTSINETFFSGYGGEDEIMVLCSDEVDNWWDMNSVECSFGDQVITKSRTINYTIPDNPPNEIRFEFIVNLKNTLQNPGSKYTYYDGDLGLSNTIWFTIFRSSIDQISELVFMPTVQDISVFYDMSSDTADLSYALATQGVTDDIEIFANLEYSGSTPLGFPSPYLKLVNTGSTESQTLYGRMDKNELYEANLKLNFVHTPTGFDYTSQYPLPAYDKPKFGEPSQNWSTFKTTGQCEHCLLASRYDWGVVGIYGQPDSPVTRETETQTPWVTNEPKIDGGSLAYSNLGGGDEIWDYGRIQYMELKNTSFLGTNLTNFIFNYVNLDGSQFLNSQINKTNFTGAGVDNVIFTSNDGLDTTQNLPYTDLNFESTSGDYVIFTDLTTKMNVEGSQFRNITMNRNLIYQSNFDGLTISGEFKDNDIVESTFQNSVLDGLNLQGSSFVSTSLALSSLKGSDLSTAWFDGASGTDFYLVECDETTILPIYGNIQCRNNYIEYIENADQEFVLDLPNDKNRASYLYDGDADSFKLLVTDPTSIAVEVSSKNSEVQFALRKSGSSTIIQPTSNDFRPIIRDDGTYTTRWAYYSDFPALGEDEYYYVQVYGMTGVFYIISYYQEQ